MPVSKSKMNFVEVATKSKAWLPPPGNYNNIDKGFNIITKGPSPRYKRGV
jgi:hypothetical protein